MATEIGKQVGRRIKEIRESRGLTQAQLATLARKSIETISNFERGKVVTSLVTLERLARLLEVQVRDFFPGGDAPLLPPEPISRFALKVRNAAVLLPDDDLEVVAGLVDVLEARRGRREV
ncbi:MAG: helix-turn-helix domain-containing protein [Bacteroidales bacterium]